MFVVVYSISALLFLILGFLIFRRVRKDYQKYKQLTPFSSFLEFFIFTVHGFFIGLSQPLSGWFQISENIILVLLGLFLTIVGALILFLGFYDFRSFKRMVGHEVNRLITSGIYRWSRNPQLVGYGLLLLAIPLFWNSWYVLITVLLYWPVAHKMALVEEEHLKDVYGKEYIEYYEKVGRYFPKFMRN